MADVDPRKAAGYVLAIAEGERGVEQPGGFFELLTRATFHADRSNLALIEQSFPNTGRAVRIYKFTEDGYLVLRQEAGLT